MYTMKKGAEISKKKKRGKKSRFSDWGSYKNGTFSPANHEEFTGCTKVRKNRHFLKVMRLGASKYQSESQNNEISGSKSHAATKF